MSQENKGNFFRYVQVVTTFGISTGLRIYILGVLGGGWVDKKLGTSPWFMLAGILLAIFMSCRYLLGLLPQDDTPDKNSQKKEK